MRLSSAGFELIKQYEGLRLEAYLCPAGVWTIGYGHTKSARSGMKITALEADQLLVSDVRAFEEAVNRAVKVLLEQHEFDALVCFAFNVGARAFRDSTLVKVLNEGRKSDVPAQLMRWTKAGGKELKGLVRRRRAEAALWRGVDEATAKESLQVGKPDLPSPRKPLVKSKTAVATLMGGGVGTLAAVNEAVETARTTLDSTVGLMSLLNPWTLAVVVILAAAAFVIWDRYQKLKEGV